MKNPQTLMLIAAGLKQHTPAMQRAFDLARAGDLRVHICLPLHDLLLDRITPLPDGRDIGRLAQQQMLDEGRAWLESLAKAWQTDGLRVTTEVLWAPLAHEAILVRTLELEPALLIKDIGHEPLLRRLLFTALDWKLLRYCPAPLLLVHELSQHLPHNILAAVDTSPALAETGPLNERILAESLKQGDYADADVHVVHAFPYLPFEAPPYRTLDKIYGMVRDADRTAFDAFAARYHVPADRRHWIEGDPARRIGDLVREGEFDLVVLGSAYRSALDRLFLGSTAENLLFRAPCDVLLVKPSGFAAELARHLDLQAVRLRVARAAAVAGIEDPAAAVG